MYASTQTKAATVGRRLAMTLVGMAAASITNLMPNIIHAQLQGPRIGVSNNYYTADNGIITYDTYSARTAIGTCWGAQNTLWGDGYIGFNLAYDGTQQLPWTYRGGGEGGVIYLNSGGDMMFVTRPSVGGNGGSICNNDIRNITRMRIARDGKVSIGNSFFGQTNQSTPGAYKLYVEDGILTEKIRVAVKTTADWQDQVFKSSYTLMPLPQLRQYIAANSHLPNVPSAEEVVKEGIDLQKMDATLLQKVEELTLYVLQQEQRIDELEEKLKSKRK